MDKAWKDKGWSGDGPVAARHVSGPVTTLVEALERDVLAVSVEDSTTYYPSGMYTTDIPFGLVANILRAAGWTVEPPK